jgi:hypothetical protein
VFELNRNSSYCSNLELLSHQFNKVLVGLYLLGELTGQLFACEHSSTLDLFPVTSTYCFPKWYYHPVYCCIIRYCLVRIDYALLMLHEKQQTVSVRSFVRE